MIQFLILAFKFLGWEWETYKSIRLTGILFAKEDKCVAIYKELQLNRDIDRVIIYWTAKQKVPFAIGWWSNRFRIRRAILK